MGPVFLFYFLLDWWSAKDRRGNVEFCNLSNLFYILHYIVCFCCISIESSRADCGEVNLLNVNTYKPKQK